MRRAIAFSALVGSLLHFVRAATTPNLKEIVLGRCLDALRALDPTPCSNLWNAFSSAVAFRTSMSVTSSDFEPFQSIASFAAPRDRALFWSGSGFIKEQVADDGVRFVTLEDTPTGMVFNTLSFCGDPATPDGFSYNASETCVFGSFNATDNQWYGAAAAFWSGASSAFARAASGHVQALLYGNSSIGQPAFRPSSFFGTVEIPNLQPANIDSLTILLVQDLGVTPKESCTTGSLVNLTSTLLARGFPPSKILCEDDPDTVRHILCATASDVPTNACLFANEVLGPSTQKTFSESVVGGLSAALAVGWIAAAGFAFLWWRGRSSHDPSDRSEIRDWAKNPKYTPPHP